MGVIAGARTVVLVVHGVGPFDREAVEADIRLQLETADLKGSEVLSLDWDGQVSSPTTRRVFGAIRPRFVAELTAAIANASAYPVTELTPAVAEVRLLKLLFKLRIGLYAVAILLLAIVGQLLFWAALSDFSIGGHSYRATSSYFHAGRLALGIIVASVVLMIIEAGAILVPILNKKTRSRTRILPFALTRRVILFAGWPCLWELLTIARLCGLTAGIVGAVVFFGWATMYPNANGPLALVAAISIMAWCYVLAAWAIAKSDGFVAPLLKATADAARYIGLPEYRRDLVESLWLRIESLDLKSDDHLVLVGHSLGTVIIADCLREQSRALRVGRVTLITMGSPLKHLFHRFFPSHWPLPAAYYAQFSESFNQFGWINVYRPNDPIGTSMGPPVADWSTHSRQSWRSAHLNYWSDPRVMEALLAPPFPVWTQSLLSQAAVSTPVWSPAPVCTGGGAAVWRAAWWGCFGTGAVAMLLLLRMWASGLGTTIEGNFLSVSTILGFGYPISTLAIIPIAEMAGWYRSFPAVPPPAVESGLMRRERLTLWMLNALGAAAVLIVLIKRLHQ